MAAGDYRNTSHLAGAEDAYPLFIFAETDYANLVEKEAGLKFLVSPDNGIVSLFLDRSGIEKCSWKIWRLLQSPIIRTM